jgi:transaldolase
VFIKVPATREGVEAFRDLTAAGVSVNVTLLFAVSRYEEIANAYVEGLERRVAAGEPVDRLASVASFFVSRVDGKVDKRLEELGHPELQGIAAVANAKLAYRSFQRIFSGPRWEALAAKGAHVQRPLWASTSTKNPAYPDTLYVDTLIGPDTVNTMPEGTIDATRDHGHAARTIDVKVDEAAEHMATLERLGVDLDWILAHELVTEGVESFAKSFDSLITTIDEKARALAPAKA